MARVLKRSHSLPAGCTPRIHPLTEWTIPAFAFPAEAGTHLPTPEGWKAELALEMNEWINVGVWIPFRQSKQTVYVSTLRYTWGQTICGGGDGRRFHGFLTVEVRSPHTVDAYSSAATYNLYVLPITHGAIGSTSQFCKEEITRERNMTRRYRQQDRTLLTPQHNQLTWTVAHNNDDLLQYR